MNESSSSIYLTCRLANQWYGLASQHIVEIIWITYLEEYPAPSPDIIGLLNLHGISMPVIDLRQRLGLECSPVTIFTPIIANSINGQHVAFLVDEVRDVVTVQPGQLKKVKSSPYITQVAELENYVLRLFDTSKLTVE